jgi:hypothetical protein
MNKIEGFVAFAPKSQVGQIEYCLWTDDSGALYVQMITNIIQAEKPGTHSNFLFRVSDFLNSETAPTEIYGMNPETFVKEVLKDNNNIGFIKAVIKHLIP